MIGRASSPKLLTLVSSRIKTLKSKQLIKEDANPVVPSLLVERIDRFDEEEERVRTTTLARCWSCQSRCKSCLQKKNKISQNLGTSEPSKLNIHTDKLKLKLT